MATEIIHIPDLGGAESVEVIELCVSPGDVVELEQSLIVLESDKATMDVPSPKAGTVKALLVKEGDTVGEGSAIVEIELSDVDAAPGVEQEEVLEEMSLPEEEPGAQELSPEAAQLESTASSEENASLEEKATPKTPDNTPVGRVVTVPDTGSEEAVEIIELPVSPGDVLSEGDSILVVETDKATMEIPVAFGGEVLKILVREGDKVNSGDEVAVLSVESAGHLALSEEPLNEPSSTQLKMESSEAALVAQDPKPESAPIAPEVIPEVVDDGVSGTLLGAEVYAGPASRALARELGVDLHNVKGSGPRGRILKEDLNNYVKTAVAKAESGVSAGSAGPGIPVVPNVDFSKFGEIEAIPLQKIQKLTAANMHRSWLNVPHVTQFDEADITDLEDFRRSLKAEAEKRGTRLTPLPFLLKACAHALVANPEFNRAITSDGETLIQKKYVHIGIAVDTPRGLVVPVVRDVDTKGLWQLAGEVNDMAAKARDGKLSSAEMQGGCFTISSLGAIGGNGFTPIVNTPEVGILGVSKSQIKPVWDGAEFIPRMMLPLSVSYDHRVVNGADCGRFFTYLVQELGDTRRLAL